jgi:hypothetical protein
MNIAFTIPEWLLWALGVCIGIPAIAAVLGLAALGVAFIKCFSGGLWR